MSEHHTCDVLVVGLGPAGSTAARFAARNGADVIAIDKRAEIGTPIQCAEGVSQSIFSQLELEPDTRWISHNVSYVKLVSPGGRVVDLNDERVAKIKYGYVLDRKVFDKDLATFAAKEGANVLLKTRFVSGERLGNGLVRAHARNFGDDVTIDAKIIIAADGVASRVGPYFGIRTFVPLKHMESCVQYEMTNLECEDAIEMYFGKEVAPGGYVWIFPKGERTANVGIGIIPSLTDKNARYYLDKFLQTPRLRNARVVEINAGGVPVSRPLKETYGDNIILAGDAARVVNPLTGGGISTAVVSGKHAGTVAAQAVAAGRHDKDALARYQRLWQDAFGHRLEMFFKAQQVLVSMSDEELDDAADALLKCNFETLSEFELLKAVAKTNIKLLGKFKTFIH
ncbi:NAD(P)/FAD-dependent oxidoreductase [archaeon]|nr:MAG: NAD(P)/FAD-dependent oxidoreductase [archaeon]